MKVIIWDNMICRTITNNEFITIKSTGPNVNILANLKSARTGATHVYFASRIALVKRITHVQMSQVRAATVIQTTVGLVPNLQQQLVVHFVHVADLTFRIWIHGVAIKEVPSRYGVNVV